MRRLLCVDPGLSVTGLAVMDGGWPTYHDQVSPSRRLGGVDQGVSQRLHIIVSALSDIAQIHHVQSVRMELLHGGYRPGTRARVKNFKDLVKLARLTGGIEHEMLRLRLALELVEPSVMRIGVGRRNVVRREVKKLVARAICHARYGGDWREHEADAVLLGAPATTAEIAAGWVAVRRADDERKQPRQEAT